MAAFLTVCEIDARTDERAIAYNPLSICNVAR